MDDIDKKSNRVYGFTGGGGGVDEWFTTVWKLSNTCLGIFDYSKEGIRNVYTRAQSASVPTKIFIPDITIV